MSLQGFVLNANDIQHIDFFRTERSSIVAKNAEQRENQCDLFLRSDLFLGVRKMTIVKVQDIVDAARTTIVDEDYQTELDNLFYVDDDTEMFEFCESFAFSDLMDYLGV